MNSDKPQTRPSKLRSFIQFFSIRKNTSAHTAKIYVFLLLAAICLLIVREHFTKRPQHLYETLSGRIEMCLSCHQKEKLDPAHDTKILGCSPCHLGSPLAIDKEIAHAGIVKNPGDLRVVEKTCSVQGCHGTDAHKVKNSLMATNRGIMATLLYYWGEAPDQNGDYSVQQLLETGQSSLALDYYRKLCATCHLWKQKGDLPGFFGTKGGGCSACHYIVNPDLPTEGPDKGHPLITKKIPVENCVRCHNRSGRIGISYTGVYESEGYGTPYEQGDLSKNRLPGNRFFLKLPPDIHYSKGMACIDCHTRNEIMGDGKRYAHFEEQLEIHCETCHTTSNPGLTAKNSMLNNLDPKTTPPTLTGKLDSKLHLAKLPLTDECLFTGHERLSCQSCHSTWVPQCYGCHVQQDKRETHLDKLTLKETPGWWQEGRSYLRYEKPSLALWKNRVMPITPGCQDIVTLKDEKGSMTNSFYSLTMAAIDPHTTQTKGRTCIDCHTSTKTLGLGEGTAWQDESGAWHFDPVFQEMDTTAGTVPTLDAFVTIDGVALQKSFRPDMRPFNAQEISRILVVGQCLACHTSGKDPIYHPFPKEPVCPKAF